MCIRDRFYFKIPRYLPKNLVAACAKPFMKKIAKTPDFGTLDWVEKKMCIRDRYKCLCKYYFRWHGG